MVTILIELLGGLGLFISGMNMMSRGIEKVAGNSLRNILKAFTRNKLLGLFVGLFFTAVIQSSSAATVMVVSFVNSGLMTLTEASGVILGANIGTTVTALLVAFRLSAIAPLFVFAGAIMMHYVKEPFTRKLGEVVMGFGILFVGISTMSSAMGTMHEIPAVINLLANFTNPVLGILLGLVITSVVQSSSVTVSILVVMSSQGLVDLRICLFVILGCNIGACTSAVLSALDGSKAAKRAALIHLLFNVFGSILMFALLMVVEPQIEAIIRFVAGGGRDAGSLGRNIAMAHLLFKVFQVIVFYPFMGQIIRLTERIVPEGDTTEQQQSGMSLKFIGGKLPNPAIAMFMAQQEMHRMANMAFDNLNLAMKALIENDAKKCDEVQEAEKYIDYLDEHISAYLVQINQNTLPLGDANLLSAYFHVVSDIERIGDHAVSIVELVPQIYKNGAMLSDESCSELIRMMGSVNKMLSMSLDMFMTGSTEHMQEIIDLENRIDEMERELQAAHIVRLREGKCSAQMGVFFSDVASGLERVSDHSINIAFALMEAKEGKRLSEMELAQN